MDGSIRLTRNFLIDPLISIFLTQLLAKLVTAVREIASRHFFVEMANVNVGVEVSSTESVSYVSFFFPIGLKFLEFFFFRCILHVLKGCIAIYFSLSTWTAVVRSGMSKSRTLGTEL